MVKNEELAKQIPQMIATLQEAADQFCTMIFDRTGDQNGFARLMLEMLSKMEPPLQELSREEPALMAPLMCKNVLGSLTNIMKLRETDIQRACEKIKFELLPLIDEFYVDLYFWGLCYPDRKKMWSYYRGEMPRLCPLPQTENAGADGADRYEVSVVVVAYNKLDYTKLCLEYLQRYFPKDVSHELILVNNGSKDGTKEFFESVHPDKQIDIQSNTKSFSVVSRIIEGKYILFVSNDVLITPHAVENLLTCVKSDEKIGCVVPACPNIANLQPLPAQYSNLDELIAFAERNNKSDPLRWEQRARLNSPLVLAPSDTAGIHAFLNYLYPNSPERFLAFTDDLMSLWCRRAGLKCILAKDAYVHHFGSVTIREETQEKQKYYADGRREFEKTFGIDPWGTGFCYDPELIGALPLDKVGPVNILGVNCGMGSNPLKIKEIIRERGRNQTVMVYNLTDQEKYSEDLKGVSDTFEPIRKWSKIGEMFPGVCFSYIVVEESDRQKDIFKALNRLFARLSPGGVLGVKSANPDFHKSLNGLFTGCVRTKSWTLIPNLRESAAPSRRKRSAADRDVGPWPFKAKGDPLCRNPERCLGIGKPRTCNPSCG